MARIQSIEDYRRLAAERKAAKAKAEANSKIIADVIKDVASTSNDPALLAELMVMHRNASN